jgi:hypothetical protein
MLLRGIEGFGINRRIHTETQRRSTGVERRLISARAGALVLLTVGTGLAGFARS